jgi:MFS family permease
MSLSMLGFAIGPLLYGPASDRHGRKPVVLFACALFMVARIGCALARSLPTLLAWRFVQGADASMTIALAIIRELFDGAVGVTTQKCSEGTTSWTKHERAARWFVRSTLDGCRSGGGPRHVSDVPRAYVHRAS